MKRPAKSNLEETFKLIKPISDYLHGHSLIAVPVVVNTLTLNLKLKDDEATNSILLVLPKGCGKNTLLSLILQKSNPDWFPELPEKMFESEIMKLDDLKFNRKVWVQEDLIVTFRGTSTKQREQLMGFFVAFLSKGTYARRGRRVDGRVVCLFGYAKENYNRYQRGMFLSTFSDRFIRVYLDFDEKMKREVLQARRRNGSRVLPTVKLPFREILVDVAIPEALEKEIDDLSMSLDRDSEMSFARAQTHINNFLKANADLNGRSEVCVDDLMLFKLTLPLYFENASTKKVDTRIRMFILEKAMNGEAVTGQEIKKEIMSKLGCSESSVKKVLSDLRSQAIVQFKKIPLSRGYDYTYWL